MNGACNLESIDSSLFTEYPQIESTIKLATVVIRREERGKEKGG